ncbi:hypothetical protein [Bradyrhizobium sp. JYMT SZCCT0428]|uniref:hypothetical protein n=1 Tax=Bradyrhizobium sp. JYMT SZCCT0428 TaxID=2807673 RepID=UPI001BAB6DB7|nr:hypothetical protein [Bradyrhizobium sp. JYMT SZCCT0428]MBR1152956.1 hypothetical protein [Bradyrhizobium sp. JYMT SZCCT0428]
MAKDMHLICRSVKAKYFLFLGLTLFPKTRTDLPVGLFCRTRRIQIAVARGAVRSPSHRSRAYHRQRFAAARFPATEIDGEYYWDGGLVSHTPRHSTVGRGRTRWPSRSICGVRAAKPTCGRRKSSSPATDRYKRTQKLRIAFASPLKDLPAELLDRPEARKNFIFAEVAHPKG